MFEPRKEMQLIGMKLDDIPEEKINEWVDWLNATPRGQKLYALDWLKKMLDMRKEMELMIGHKLDHIPDKYIIQWSHWVKRLSPESQSEVMRGFKKAIILSQGI